MVNKREILALIPARSGSQRVAHKNIRVVAGKPLLAHSIEHALRSKLVTRVIVSTDSEQYAEIARAYGAEAPFLRPSDLAGPHSTDLETFLHALSWLKEKEECVPEICVHLRPTAPVRDVEDIDGAVKVLVDNPEYDSVRSVIDAPETPFKMWFRSEAGLLSPVVECRYAEAYNMPRQVLPATYLQNACIDIVRTKVLLEQKSMTGKKIFGYVMNHNFDIDYEQQLAIAEQELVLRQANAKTFCFDIDGVIATVTMDNNYSDAGPIEQNIKIINQLYAQGHTIVLFTARGSKTGIDWAALTKKQMSDWGVLYHELRFGKPAADYYVDDKFFPLERISSLARGRVL